jgi:cytochrome c peroxidase
MRPIFPILSVFLSAALSALPAGEALRRPTLDPRLGTPDPATIEWPDGEPASQATIDLGRTLFHDTRLSKNRNQSCATCHNPDLGFGDGLAKGFGTMGNQLERNTPHLYNLAWSTTMFWDGRMATLEEQALGPIQAAGEMGMDIPGLLARLQEVKAYQERFASAFGGPGITAERVGSAIAAYERTIVSRNSAFDRYVAGDSTALGPEAKRGLDLFVGKANCIACHSGPNFTDGSFHNLGMRDADRGRAAVVAGATMEKAFKTPGLRNTALTAPYMHDGSEPSLEAVVRFYNRGGDAPTSNPLVRKLGLTEAEIADTVAFLGALTDPVATDRPEVP